MTQCGKLVCWKFVGQINNDMILIQLGTVRVDSCWTCDNCKSLESGLMQGCWYNVGFVDETLDQRWLNIGICRIWTY